VTFTKKCAIGFKDHYDTGNAGAYLTWPGGDACGVCQATGTKIKPDSKTRHLLIVWEMAGRAANGVLCYLVIPRILTREGYEKIMGGPGNHRCTAKDKTFYTPRRQTFDGTLGELCSWGKGAPPAGAAWSQVHSDGTYCAIERWFKDERTLWNPDSGIDTSPCTFMSRSGVDPSTYAEASTSGDSLSMKELKAAIEIAGMSHADCLEKSDLLKRYKEAQDKRTKESWSRGFEPPTSQPIPSTASANKLKPSKAEVCNLCGASAKKLLRCARCVTAGRVPAAYCSKECQKLAWPAHKKGVCKPLPQTLCSVCKVARVSTAADAKQNGTLFFCCGAVICYSCSTADDSWTCPCCGKKLPTTDEGTLEVLRKAAKRGDSSAQWNLGRAYDTGRFGVKVDHVEAAKWVLKAAEQGHAKAEHAMGVNYRDGEGVAVNNVEARKWFHRVAVQGHVEAQCDLGIMIFYAIKRGEENASLDEAEIWHERQQLRGTSLLRELWVQLRCLGY